jgi:Coenzyme F420-reducing hydrogenase, beta subunit
MNNVDQIIKSELCTGCGTCISLCPSKVIKMTLNDGKGIYLPKLNENKCNGCGICLKVCPGHEVNFKDLNLEIFGRKPDDTLIGNYEQCYIGHSKNQNIRYRSTSGGLITQILISALESGMIDGALVTRMKDENPLESEPFIARTKKEIIEAIGSKYCPVPTNISIREILDSEEEKFAFVGLPCHIHGIRKAEQINQKLKEKIVLHMGIFCGMVPSFNATVFLLKQLKIEKSKVKNISYRGKGWPGNLVIELNDKSKKEIPYPNYWGGFLSFFFPVRCHFCYDWTSELADISFGDPWLPHIKNKDKIGCSIIILKTENGLNFLNNEKIKENLKLYSITPEDIHKSQINSYLKKKDLKNRLKIFKNLNYKTPIYSVKLKNSGYSAYFRGIESYIKMRLGLKKQVWSLILLYNNILRFGSHVKSYIVKK